MNELISKEQKDKITSLELVEQINIFREQEGNRKELQHNDLLKIIRDEFEDEIHEGKISQMFYDLKIGNGATRKSPMFELTLNQAKQVLMDMRQILNTVVRYKGANYQERWRLLYFEFEKNYHIDVKRRMENYNKTHKPKLKSKLDYIDFKMKKLPQLYEIACKLFEGDINQIVENYKKVC